MSLEELIQKSLILTDEEKQFYLFMIPLLSKQLLKKLQRIFEQEQKTFESTEENHSRQKIELNKKFLKDLKEFYEQEYKKESVNEENEEKEKAEILLKQLNI